MILVANLPADEAQEERIDHIYQHVGRLLLTEPARYPFHYISIAALLTRL